MTVIAGVQIGAETKRVVRHMLNTPGGSPDSWLRTETRLLAEDVVSGRQPHPNHIWAVALLLRFEAVSEAANRYPAIGRAS